MNKGIKHLGERSRAPRLCCLLVLLCLVYFFFAAFLAAFFATFLTAFFVAIGYSPCRCFIDAATLHVAANECIEFYENSVKKKMQPRAFIAKFFLTLVDHHSIAHSLSLQIAEHLLSRTTHLHCLRQLRMPLAQNRAGRILAGCESRTRLRRSS